MADIFLPTHEDEHLAFADIDAGATLVRCRGLGVPEVMVKHGKQPTIFECDGKVGIRPVASALAIDTTGAGDSFNGAYLVARLGGASMTEAIA